MTHWAEESRRPAPVSGGIEYHIMTFILPGSVSFEEGESEAESSNMDTNNPVFQLFEAVRGARNSQGQIFSDPFQQLPSRREYPDYYQQIKQPICLQQIRYVAKRSGSVKL